MAVLFKNNDNTCSLPSENVNKYDVLANNDHLNYLKNNITLLNKSVYRYNITISYYSEEEYEQFHPSMFRFSIYSTVLFRPDDYDTPMEYLSAIVTNMFYNSTNFHYFIPSGTLAEAYIFIPCLGEGLTKGDIPAVAIVFRGLGSNIAPPGFKINGFSMFVRIQENYVNDDNLNLLSPLFDDRITGIQISYEVI